MPTSENRPRTLYDKVFQDHIVEEQLDGTILLYIGQWQLQLYRMSRANSIADRHLVHEVTSPVCSFDLSLPPLRHQTDPVSSKLLRASKRPTAKSAAQTALWQQLITYVPCHYYSFASSISDIPTECAHRFEEKPQEHRDLCRGGRLQVTMRHAGGECKEVWRNILWSRG